MKVKRTERGWPGHFICASQCLFRRNTLLEYGNKRVIVSTVGDMERHRGGTGTISYNRDYETMAFEARYDDPYWEANVEKEISFDSDWQIHDFTIPNVSNLADQMHEKVVEEISNKLLRKEL